MITIDARTRPDAPPTTVGPAAFLRDHAGPAVEANGAAAARGVARLDLPPMTLDVAGERVTFEVDGGRLTVGPGGDGRLVVSLDEAAFSDLVQDTASTFATQMTGRATVRSGSIDDFVMWDPVLRCLLDGRPVHEPGDIEFRALDGSPLDLRRSFGAGPTNGELGVVAGSNRANVPALGVAAVDLPRLPLPTRTGDVTVHCSCTLHMSRPPVSAERRVVYTGFGLAPRPEDRRAQLDEATVRANRASLNDHVRRQQRDATTPGARTGSYEL